MNLDLDVQCSSMKLTKSEEENRGLCASQKSKSTKASEAVTAIASVGSAATTPEIIIRKK